MTALVLGIGNDWRGDDGAGPEVVRRLRAAGIPAREVGADPCSLIDAWAGAGDVILVDAVRSGAAPGTVHRLAAGAHALPAGLVSASTHHVGLAAAVELARALGRLPAALEVYGIEVADCDAARGLSPAVARAVGEVTAELAARASPG